MFCFGFEGALGEETGKLNPGWKPLPRPQSPKEGSPLRLPPLGRPGARRTSPPHRNQAPSSYRGQRHERTSTGSSETVWDRPRGGFYTRGGGRSGRTGRRTNRIGRLPAAAPRPRSVWDVGGPSEEVREGPGFCGWRLRAARYSAPGDPYKTPDPAKGAPSRPRGPMNSAQGGAILVLGSPSPPFLQRR